MMNLTVYSINHEIIKLIVIFIDNLLIHLKYK